LAEKRELDENYLRASIARKVTAYWNQNIFNRELSPILDIIQGSRAPKKEEKYEYPYAGE
jgi:hypothetical protein